MKKSITRRFRRSRSTHDPAGPTKEGKEQKFFGSRGNDSFFQPGASIQRSAEDETIHRAPEMGAEKEKEKVQRAAEQEKKEEEKIQKKDSDAGGGTGVQTANYIDSIGSKGQPLPSKEQSFFGKKMGYDFSSVRIHTGRDAAESARDVSAKAYTYGRHIVFNDGQYNTESQQGRTLIAHELTHVVQ